MQRNVRNTYSTGPLAALIVPSQRIHWVSVNKILTNLLKAYSLAFDERIKLFKLDFAPSLAQLKKLSKDIKKFNPQFICFLGMKPHPMNLLPDIELKSTPNFIFHLYGDFTQCPNIWGKSAKYLKNALFLCASPKHNNLVRSFMRGENTSICPFPCNPEEFYFSKKLRFQKRKQLGLNHDDVMIIYSGRISPQKNILLLIKTFSRAAEKNEKLKLFIVGGFDNINPFFSDKKIFMQSEFYSLLHSLPEKIKSRITHLKHISATTSLNKLYNAADVFVSLSTFHDEDFGIAALEALFCGTRAILTDWGGHSSFKSKFTQFVPVKITTGKLHISEKTLYNYLVCAQKTDPVERNHINQFYKNKYSVHAISQSLLKIFETGVKSFEGFSPLCKQYGKLYLKTTFLGKPMYKDGPQKKGLYHQLYSHYTKS